MERKVIIQEVDRVEGAYYIYTLADEREPSAVRYIGLTTDPYARYVQHIHAQKRIDFALWWRSIIAEGSSVLMRVMHVTPSQDRGKALERAVIAMYAECGASLFNVKDNPCYQKPKELVYDYIREVVRQERPSPPTESEYPVPPLTYCWSMTDHQKDTLGYGSDIGQRIENQQRDKMIIKTSEGWKKAKRVGDVYVWVN